MKLAKSFLAIGIAIIFAVFVAYGYYTIYEPPGHVSTNSSECYKTYNCQS